MSTLSRGTLLWFSGESGPSRRRVVIATVCRCEVQDLLFVPRCCSTVPMLSLGIGRRRPGPRALVVTVRHCLV
ncbi:hypothetical protein [Bartonella sp. CL41QHWL]|uniref:hypothetical protein n=1 Tax=Bartonella sp. CL41QHWL TaxID=3243527 RepID=UPI0035D08DEC